MADLFVTRQLNCQVIWKKNKLHFGPCSVRRASGEAWSDVSAGHIKPKHLYNYLNEILLIALEADK